MLGPVLQPEMRELLAKKDFATLKVALRELEAPDVAELLEELDSADQALLFRLLSHDVAADVFSLLSLENQEQLIQRLGQASLAAILNEMTPDDRTELLEELPGELAQRLLDSLRGEERAIAQTLLNYPVDSVGRLMTPEYVAVRPAWTVEQVIEHIRKVARQKETVHHLYVVDDKGRLLDHISLDEVVLAPAGALVSSIMSGPPEEPALHASWDKEAAVEMFKKYDASTLPVVDGRGVLVGIVTSDDVLDVQEEEFTEDMQLMAGLQVLEDTYFQTSRRQMIQKRLPWLALLFMAELVTALVIFGFEDRYRDLLIVFLLFMPVVNASAGNAGSQMAGLVIRGLAVAEMDVRDWGRVCGRELVMGLLLGLALAAMGLVAPFLFGRPWQVSVTLALALLSAITVANLAGAMTPFLLKRLGLDPAVTSSPLIASLMDVLSVAIYYGTAVIVTNSLT